MYKNSAPVTAGHLLKQMTKMENEAGKAYNTFPGWKALEIPLSHIVEGKAPAANKWNIKFKLSFRKIS